MTESDKARRFQQAVLAHLDASYNLARWLTRDEREAEDIVQEAYLRAFKFFDSFRGGDGRAWILAIVRNIFFSERGHRHATVPFDDEIHEMDGASAETDDVADTDPQAILSRADNARLLNQALADLPIEFREVIVLRELEDMAYREIASVTGIPMGTVMSRLARARKMLAASVKRLSEESCDGM